MSKTSAQRMEDRPAGVKRRDAEARILTAAEEVFAEAGYSGATTAAIADRAGLPKANLHYYFRTKEALYRRLIERILEEWLASGDQIRPEADPAEAFSTYIAAKIEASRRRPFASKVFANEILHGAPHSGDFLKIQVRAWVEAKGKVIDGWVKRGLIRPIEPHHLFFILWAATQTYADFETQIRAVLARKRIRPADYEEAARLITRMVLGACGVDRKVRKS
ncbi:MAG TPA: TetR/AcrR family transcriptional regulator [Alphaproteobacteria bacterium]|nr:TetR/AcrR family transcriptional regulator [Alphaproteobacteria bacterium]